MKMRDVGDDDLRHGGCPTRQLPVERVLGRVLPAWTKGFMALIVTKFRAAR
jgi:hypothetical protein